jgi:predicted Zn finger-like uncharacterized protein
MDVRCSRCGTEYDFDDALVSERGTTVKCTNCGHQFKVFPGGAGGAPERWIVRKGSGRELVYTSLRDLQRAIAQRQVGPHDLLSRGGSQPLRPLGAIAELEPFFLAQGPAPGAPAPDPGVQRTLLGISPASAPQPDDTVPDQVPFEETLAVAQHPMSRGAATAPPSLTRPSAQDAEPKTLPRNLQPQPIIPPDPPMPATMGSASHGAQQYRPTPPVDPPQANDGVSSAFRAYQDSFSDEPLPGPVRPPRQAALRWVVGLVLLGVIAFVGGTVGVRYAKSLRPAAAPSAAPADDRVKKLLDLGKLELSRGDFESAKEQFDKASALSEKDPAVLSALAHFEAARADVHWLSSKVVDPANTAGVDAERSELTARLSRVRRATDSAVAAAPTDRAVLRARIDTLRLAGDVSAARALVGQLGPDSSDPETAYVLAALDLAEPTPAWSTAIDRLRTAASTERGFGRARAALVYALASTGAADEAKGELAKLESSGPSGGLLAKLREFVGKKTADAIPSASAAEPAPSASAPPVAAVGALPLEPRPPGEPAVPRGLDFRKLLEDASAAKRGGDLARAEALYRAAQEQQPGNIEALAGLGDVARMRGNAGAASGYYEAVLQQNPMYLPALIAQADMKWQAGDRAGAVTLYKRVANQTGSGTPYGQKAAQRLAEAQGSPGPERPSETPPPAPAPEPNPEKKPPGDTPHIDTSDLPGFR